MPELAEGQEAPDFALPSTTGEEIRLPDFRGRKNVVLYFYPKDSTPGCTTEACSFRDAQAEMAELDTQVLGVSRDSIESHGRFSDKYGLSFPLLSDAQGKVTESYGVWREKNMYGKTQMGIVRSTFVIDKQGIIRKVYRKVSVNGHSEEVKEFIRANLL